MTSILLDYVRYDTTGAFAPGPEGPPLEITEVSYNEDTHEVTLTWRAIPETFYAIQGSFDMKSWPIDIDDSFPANPDGELTSHTFVANFDPPLPDDFPTRAFYQVRVAN